MIAYYAIICQQYMIALDMLCLSTSGGNWDEYSTAEKLSSYA